MQELQTLVNDREKTIKGLKETLFTLEAAKHSDDPNGVSQGYHQGQDANNGPGPSRIERSNTRSSLKLQIQALSAKGWQSEEVDEEQEEGGYQNGALSPSGSDSNIQTLSVTSPGRSPPGQRPSGGVFSPGVTSPKIGQRFLGTGGGRRPALPPPPPPPGPKHKLYATAQAANGQVGTQPNGTVAPPPPPPQAQPSGSQMVPTPPVSIEAALEPPQPTLASVEPEVGQINPAPLPVSMQTPKPESLMINTSAPPPPPPPPFIAACNPQAVTANQPSLAAAIQSGGGIPIPPPPPPVVFAAASQPAPAAGPTGPPMGGGPPPPPPPPPFVAGSAPVTATPAEPLLSSLQRSVSMPTPKPKGLAGSPPPPPPPPPATGGTPPPPPPPMPNAPFGKSGLKPPSQPLPPPPPPGPQPQGAAALEGAIPTLPVFLAGNNRTANPLKPLAMAIPQVVKPTRPMKVRN